MNGNVDVRIRPLQPSDYPEWFRLRHAIWPDMSAEKNSRETEEILANPAQMPVFVAARAEGGLCGFVEVAVHERARGCNSEGVGYLEAWYVDPDRRRRGVGRALVDAAEEWARARGCSEMASDTNESYPLSPRAHTRLGYQEVARDIYFRKEL